MHTKRHRKLVWPALAAVAVAAALAGCQDPILTATEPRSQYDRYDALREQRAASYVENVFGRDKPNLRGRLLLKD